MNVRLDRLATLYRNNPTVSASGQVVDVLTELGTIYLGREQMNSHTIIAGGRDAVDTEDVFQSRWADVRGMSLIFDCEGLRYRVTRCDEIGRRDRLRLFARAIT